LAERARSPADPRAAAALVVAQVLGGRSLSDLMPPPGVASADRALAAELCFGTCRWFHRLDFQLGRLLSSPLKPRDADVRGLLLVGMYQLVEMRLPAHAAVASTVEAARSLGKPWATRLVNGLLRAFLRRRDELDAAADAVPAARYAHPAWLVETLQRTWPDHWQAMLSGANARPPMTLRVNRLRHSRGEYLQILRAAGIGADEVPHAAAALVLDRPGEASALPGFADGAVSVQDAAAQLAAPLLDPVPGDRVLDACAAPGGKTAHLLEHCPEAHVTAVDVDAARLERVRENLGRLALRADVVEGDAERPAGSWAQQSYDRILLDVPCTATGVIRRHPDIKLLRRAEDPAAMAARQARILDAVWPLLRPGGILLYVTCSLLPDENDEQVARFLARAAGARALAIDAPWGHARGAGRQTLPGEGGMDGFFYARLTKEGR
jgi:16S rRNA (cytosine967-C5)-methyltransferase